MTQPAGKLFTLQGAPSHPNPKEYEDYVS